MIGTQNRKDGFPSGPLFLFFLSRDHARHSVAPRAFQFVVTEGANTEGAAQYGEGDCIPFPCTGAEGLANCEERGCNSLLRIPPDPFWRWILPTQPAPSRA